MPAAVSVAGIARRGNLLFIARRLSGGDLGGKWEFPGGKVEDGESDEAALIREFREEFGLRISVGPPLCGADFEHRGIRRKLRASLIELKGEPRLREHSEWKWAAPEEIETLDFADSDLKLLPALKTYLATT
jgi:8-oxo-dGTP diphosphatase